jgi:predicted Rossmann fold flavoprotein
VTAYDVVVVGAGAAGLMAATEAALRGRRVALLEKNQHPGLKILISGGGRCNLTTTRAGRDLEEQYGARRGRWLRHALRAFPPRALCALIESLGVPLREEDLEKIFPVSGRARDVLDALLRRAEASGVALVRGAPMQRVEADGAGFRVHTPRGAFAAPALVLATGGLSYPKTGATGDGYAVARQLGHTITPTVPHLAPLAIDAAWVHALQGVVVDAGIALRGPDGAVRKERRRPVLFTHRGLSGPAPMDVAGDVEECGGGCTLVVDFAPDQRREDVEAALLDGARQQGRRPPHALLPAALPERLRRALATLAGAGETTAAELTKERRRALVEHVKALRLPVERSLGFAAAEVTRGGVALDEVDARTCASARQPGLFLCGEILDVDGPIGGFNFQAAFATGRLAGQHAADFAARPTAAP